jgi:hemoglobin
VSQPNATLFDRLGGEAAVEAAVISFYEKVMTDPSLAPFFEHLDMNAQINKQIAFMTMAFGGPNKYSGKDLRTAHAKIVAGGLHDKHFDAVAEHLRVTLAELGVDATTTSEVLDIVGGTRNDVMNR